jgi:CubicO group peptidase (beta-lactamase class C family)
MTLPHLTRYSGDSHNLKDCDDYTDPSLIDEAIMSYTKSFFALLSILILLSTLPVVWPATIVSAQSFPLEQVDRDRIDAYIQSRMQTANIPGLALGVVYGDEVAYLKGYGIAAPDGRAVTPQTPFILGSTSKSFTALAVMQLVEAGKIDLDAPVTTYLPCFRTNDAAASAPITVRHLLNQNSGLPDYEGRQGIADNDQSSTALENGVRDLSGVQLSQPAGQSYEYANENYNILGLIIQAVSGSSYEEYIRSAIFAPLQMTQSAAARSDPAAIDIATGYRYWFFWSVAFDAPYPRSMTPSGFLISSAEDMSHYLIAQLNGGAYGNNQLLSPEGIVTLHTPGARISSLSSYGMGWVIEGQPGSTRIWHNGDTSNFHSNMLLLPDQRIGIVILVNVGGFLNSSAINVPIEGVAEILLGNSLTASTNPPLTVIPQVLLTVLLIPALWFAGSYLSIRRWQYRGELPPHGSRRFLRLYMPLAIDLLPVSLAWIILTAQFNASMEVVALFAPDAFIVIATLTALSIGWALVRIFLTFRPSRLTTHASGRAQTLAALGD